MTREPVKPVYSPIAEPSAWSGLGAAGPTRGSLEFNYPSAVPDDVRQAVRRVLLRAAAFETGAVEGLYEGAAGATVNFANEAPGWRDLVSPAANSDLDVDALLASQFHAYKTLRGHAREEHSEPVTEVFIRQLHSGLTAPQSTYDVETPVGRQSVPLVGGEYKSYPNHVFTRAGTLHAYCPPDDVPNEMARLATAFRSQEFVALPAVVQAAYAHWGVVHVHPFPDENGRVARALASLFLLREFDLPLIVYSDRKRVYFQALEACDAGEYSQLVSYVAGAINIAAAWQVEMWEERSAPRSSEALAYLADLLQRGNATVPLESASTVGERLLREVARQLSHRIDSLQGGAVKIELQDILYRGDVLEYMGDWTYPAVDDKGWFRLRLDVSIEAPIPAYARTFIDCLMPGSASSDRPEILLVSSENSGNSYEPKGSPFRLVDLSPDLSEESTSRVDIFAETVLRRCVRNVSYQVEAFLRQRGAL